MTRRRTVAAAAILAGALALTACGTNRQEAPGTGAGGASCDTSKGTLVIGMVAPLSGGLSALGLGMRNSADLAVKQANESCAVPGYQLVFQAEDDQATPQVAGQAATKLASDDNVVGVVGTLNSSTAQTVQPILAGKSIVQVSPANTGPSLTRGEDPTGAPKRQFESYFRVSTTDLVQGPFAANYLVQKAGKKNIAVIDDGKTYGVGLANEFAKQAEKLGANIVARERVGEKDTDFNPVITKIRPLNPDAVYYGGEYPVAGPLSRQLAGQGLDIPLMGGDGIVDAKFVELGGREGDLATNVGAPTESLPSAAKFVADYKAANYPEPYSAYGAFAYDSTNVIIQALKTALAGGDYNPETTRPAIVKAVQDIKLDGAGGPISFDEYGDTTNKLLTVYTVKNGEFTPIETGTFEG
ncbi:amino acid/amide ABC transporter substrate-binding protein, HAAT family [Pseudonocardia thermophila]|jgi:ABC-type branched-chain amino acid transport systems, periplasmic component|uniref:Amino acid/amide ABC transporter substrate-binding protein, HAAT family n=1 Tax=Pseudonocardia thermophila TaxID=1848 RepID=A0A1M6ZJV3_PSETH|nr:branched-chain amino acid ABC transporter substrate-binding protein [Pseudonocardia thermophila]SHL30798.1 amino acid/amide ABC transporter substrate-binding protein, HAAT family [Pseudonocardia thermophila]